MGGGGRFEVKGCLKASDPSGLSSSPSFPLDGILVFRRFPPPPTPPLFCLLSMWWDGLHRKRHADQVMP